MSRSFSLPHCLPAALCTVLLLCGPTWVCAKPLTAIFLVARSGLSDPFFAKSVVLVMNDIGPSPIGLIINKPTSIRLARIFPNIRRLAQVRDTVYFGGPVATGSVWFLFRARGTFPHAVRVLRGVYLSADPKLLLRLLERQRPLRGLRVYAGHAGWAPGQLQSEIRMGFWNLKRADAAAIFNGKSEHPPPAPRGSQRAAWPASDRHLVKTIRDPRAPGRPQGLPAGGARGCD